jgi:maltose O-acetyltransferase
MSILNFLKKIIFIRKTGKYLYYFFVGYFQNYIIQNIPIYYLRRLYMELFGLKITHERIAGGGTIINMHQYILDNKHINVGKNTHINKNCLLDGRGGLFIGDNVSISFDVKLITGSHDVNSNSFAYKKSPIHIDNYVWIGAGAIILPGCKIGKGAVVTAGSVVTKDVEDFTIVAGVPAKQISNRITDLDYKCQWDIPFV